MLKETYSSIIWLIVEIREIPPNLKISRAALFKAKKTCPSFYLPAWLVGCGHRAGVGQLAWKESWSSALTQDQSLRWRNPQGGLGRGVGPLKPCPRAWVPKTTRAPSHLDSSG